MRSATSAPANHEPQWEEDDDHGEEGGEGEGQVGDEGRGHEPGEKQAKKLNQTAAAVEVVPARTEPMTAKAMVEAIQAKGYWTSPAGKTPEATLYASILRDIRKGKEARFVKTGWGMFTLAAK